MINKSISTVSAVLSGNLTTLPVYMIYVRRFITEMILIPFLSIESLSAQTCTNDAECYARDPNGVCKNMYCACADGTWEIMPGTCENRMFFFAIPICY